MFLKSIRDFFKNPIITLPNIFFSVTFQILVIVLFGNIDMDLLYSNPLDAALAEKAAALLLSALLIWLIYAFLSPIIFSCSNLLAKKVANNEDINLLDVLKHSFKYYWRIFGANILIGVIIFGVYMFFVFVIFLTAGTSILSSPESISPAIALIILPISLIFLISILFIIISLSPVQSVLVYDDIDIGDALKKGFMFGIKKFFPILGVILLLLTTTIGVTVILSSIFGDKALIGQLLSSIIGGYFTIFLTIYMMNKYKEYNMKKSYSINQGYNQPYQNNYPPYQALDDKKDIPAKENEPSNDDDSNNINSFRI